MEITWAVILKVRINTKKGNICNIFHIRKKTCTTGFLKTPVLFQFSYKITFFSGLRNYSENHMWAVILKFCMNA